MRTEKSIINVIINIINYIIMILPNLLIRKIFLMSLGSQLLGLNSLYQKSLHHQWWRLIF